MAAEQTKRLGVLGFLVAWPVLCLVGVGAQFGWSSVILANGLQAPVTFKIDGKSYEVGPGARKETRLSAGLHETVASMKEANFPSVIADVPTWSSGTVSVLNAGGAAPIYAVSHGYSASPDKSNYKPSVLMSAGHPFRTFTGMDYIFEEPPHSISVEHASGTIVKWQLTESKGGWGTSVGLLNAEGTPEEQLTLMKQLAIVEPDDEGVASTLAFFSPGPTGAIEVLKEAATKHPDSVQANKHLVFEARHADRLEEIRGIYAARLARDPSDDVSRYILARASDLDTAKSLLKEGLSRSPDQLLFHKGLALLLLQAGEYAESAEHFLALAEGEDEEYPNWVPLHMQALAGKGDANGALKLAVDMASKPEVADMDWAIAYGLIAHQVSHPPMAISDVIKRATKDSPWIAPLVQVSIQEKPTAYDERKVSPDVAPAIAVMLAIPNGPASTLTKCAGIPESAAGHLPSGVGVLAAAEADRLGDAALAARLLRGVRRADISLTGLRHAVREGELPGDVLNGLEGDVRAAIALSRGRWLEAQGKDGTPFYAEADRKDVLNTLVSTAAAKWPHPSPADPGAVVIAVAPPPAPPPVVDVLGPPGLGVAGTALPP